MEDEGEGPYAARHLIFFLTLATRAHGRVRFKILPPRCRYGFTFLDYRFLSRLVSMPVIVVPMVW